MEKELIENLIMKNTLIGLRTNRMEWGKTLIGFVQKIDESKLTINEIDEHGFLIGQTEIALVNITHVDMEDRYQKRLKLLHSNSSKLETNKGFTIWNEGEKLLPYLEKLIESKKITTFHLDENDYTIGILSEYTEKYFIINCIGVEGDEDGTSCYPISKLEGLTWDSIQEQKIELLYKHRSEFYK